MKGVHPILKKAEEINSYLPTNYKVRITQYGLDICRRSSEYHFKVFWYEGQFYVEPLPLASINTDRMVVHYSRPIDHAIYHELIDDGIIRQCPPSIFQKLIAKNGIFTTLIKEGPYDDPN